MKICTKCKLEKDENDYYKCGKYFQKHCKVCNNKMSTNWQSKNKERSLYNLKKWREKNKDKLNIQRKKWELANNDKLYKQNKEYRETNKIRIKSLRQENKQETNKYSKEYLKNTAHYKKHKCRWKLRHAIKAGKIRKRNSCEICHNYPTECHHDDYTKPFEFIELCVRCHKFLHHQYIVNTLFHANNTT